MGSGGSGAGPGTGGGSFAGGSGWGGTMGGGSGYGGDLGGLGTAGTMSGGAGGAGMDGYGGGGQAGMSGSGWNGAGGSAGGINPVGGYGAARPASTAPPAIKNTKPAYTGTVPPGYHVTTTQTGYVPGEGPMYTHTLVSNAPSPSPIGGVTSPGMPGGMSPGGFAVNAGGFNQVGNTNTGLGAKAPSLGDRNLGSMVGGTGGSMTTGGAQGGGLNRTGTSAGRF